MPDVATCPLTPDEASRVAAALRSKDPERVKDAQTRLNAAGATPRLTVDGQAGPMTWAAYDDLAPDPPPPVEGFALIGRSAWGAKPYKGTPQPLKKVEWVTVHHTATAVLPLTYEAGRQQVQAVQQMHFDRGWSDVGYHFLLSQDGTWWQGRAQSTPQAKLLDGLALGSHVGGRNTGNVGVSVMGYFHAPKNHRMTDEATAALRAMLKALCERYSLDGSRIRGHKEWAATDCPGSLLMPVVAQIRAEL